MTKSIHAIDDFDNLVASALSFRYSASVAQDSRCIVAPHDATRLSDQCTPTGLLARRLFEHLGCDEHATARWRLDHKLVQSRLLHQLVPLMAPPTIGLNQARHSASKGRVAQFLSEVFPEGYVLKKTRGWGSQRSDVLASPTLLTHLLADKHIQSSYQGTATSELYMVQSMLDLVYEFRVHTMRRDVIRSLTFCTSGMEGHEAPGSRAMVESFVLLALSLLPDALCSDMVLGWDVGVLPSGACAIIEINYPGLYPPCSSECNCEEYSVPLNGSLYLKRRKCSPGFNCSGMLHNRRNLARFLEYVQHQFNVTIILSDELSSSYTPLEVDFMAQVKAVMRWRRLLQVADELADLGAEARKRDPLGGYSLYERVHSNKADAFDRFYLENLECLARMSGHFR